MSSGDNEGIDIENSNAVENFIQGEIFADIFPNMPALTPKKSIKKEKKKILYAQTIDSKYTLKLLILSLLNFSCRGKVNEID